MVFSRCSPQVHTTETPRYLPIARSLPQAHLGVSTIGMCLSNTTLPGLFIAGFADVVWWASARKYLIAHERRRFVLFLPRTS